jgi:type II secretory pathway pseudopilin PulG
MLAAVLAAFAATVAPYLVGNYDQTRVSAAVADLRMIGTGIVNFRTGVGHFPSKTSMLSTLISRAMRNSCWTGASSPITATDSTNWLTTGPFGQPLYVPSGGFWTPIGRLRDSIPSRAANGAMFIEMPGVVYADAQRFKAAVDSNAAIVGDTVSILHLPVANNPDTTTIRMRLFVAGTFNSC